MVGGLSNKARGTAFEEAAARVLSVRFGVEWHRLATPTQPLGHEIRVLGRPRQHRFDLVSTDFRYIGECKSHTWRKDGEVPNGKVQEIDGAVALLSNLPTDIARTAVRFVAIRKATHPKRKETLAEYYYRLHRPLPHDILIIEIDMPSDQYRDLGPDSDT